MGKSQRTPQRYATYAPPKYENYQVQLTEGGNLIIYPGEVNTPTADLITIKKHWNSVISMPNANYMILEVNYFSQHPDGKIRIYSDSNQYYI